MNIVVLVKQVPDTGSERTLSEATHCIPVITVRPGAFGPQEHLAPAVEQGLTPPPVDPAASARITARRAAPAGDRPSLTEATTVVSGGRGVGPTFRLPLVSWLKPGGRGTVDR